MKLAERPTRIRRPPGTSFLNGEEIVQEVFRLEEYVQPDDYLGLAEEIKIRDISTANETRFALLFLGQQKKDYLKFSAWKRTEAELLEYEEQISQDPKNIVLIGFWLALAGRAVHLFPGKRARLLNPEIIKLCTGLVLHDRVNQIDLILLMPENKEEFGVNETWAKKIVDGILENGENILQYQFFIQAISLFFPNERKRLTVLLPKLKQEIKNLSNILHSENNTGRISSSAYSVFFRTLSLIRLISAESVHVDQTGVIQVVDRTTNIKPRVSLPQRSID